MAISISITFVATVIITAIVFSLICYCIRSKGGLPRSPSPVTAYFPVATTTVSTSGVSSLEMKDNMAYGHIGRPTATSVIYENIIN